MAALVELKARFDEQANIEWARALEQAGVHVVYGLVGLKTHTKTALVVRDEADGIRRYCHIGTGNYNPKTARLYEDLGLLTADPDIGADLTAAVQLPHRLRPRRPSTASCSSRRTTLRAGIVDAHPQRDGAPAGDGRIVMKMNSLVDPDDDRRAVRRRRRPACEIDLIVRGICCLRPGVPGLSEQHPGALDRRPLPRALAHLPVRQRRGPTAARRTTSARPT